MFDFSLGELSGREWALNLGLLVVMVGGLIILFRPSVSRSVTWRATVTPLASIIGSGFLVVAPVMGFAVGIWAVLAMAGILILAWLVGAAVRYNISEVENLEEGEEEGREVEAIKWLDELSKLVLALAYVIAVAFYLELLGAFLLKMLGIEDRGIQKLVATGFLVFIGTFGVMRGLRSLERLEEFAVNAKLSVIAAFLVGLLIYNSELLLGGKWELPDIEISGGLNTVRTLLGAFLIVQGFETSRYLRGTYESDLRIRSMAKAQWIAGSIYLVFVGLATVLFDTFETTSETGVIELSGTVALILPPLLVLGAVTSQFSAAVADTIGAGGLVEEASSGRFSKHITYGVVSILAAGLLWSTDIFSIIAHASRAFAAYYSIQCLIGSIHAFRLAEKRKPVLGIGFVLLSVVMLLIAVFAIPVEAADH